MEATTPARESRKLRRASGSPMWLPFVWPHHVADRARERPKGWDRIACQCARYRSPSRSRSSSWRAPPLRRRPSRPVGSDLCDVSGRARGRRRPAVPRRRGETDALFGPGRGRSQVPPVLGAHPQEPRAQVGRRPPRARDLLRASDRRAVSRGGAVALRQQPARRAPLVLAPRARRPRRSPRPRAHDRAGVGERRAALLRASRSALCRVDG